MTLLNASTWKAYWVSESVPGTTPSNPAFNFLGAVTSGRPTPNPNYKQVRASGVTDYYINQQMSLRPSMSISIVPSSVAFLTTLVSSNQAFTLVLRDSTNSMYVRNRGTYIDRCRIDCTVEDNVTVDLDTMSYTTDNTAPTLGSGSYASDDSTALYYQNVTLSKDGSAITDWSKATFEVNKNFIRRLTPSNGNTRALETTARDHSLTLTRDMDTADAFNEYADINANTSRTMKLKLDNANLSASWSVQLNSAKATSFDADILKPEDIMGKDLTYIGTTLTFGTS